MDFADILNYIKNTIAGASILALAACSSHKDFRAEYEWQQVNKPVAAAEIKPPVQTTPVQTLDEIIRKRFDPIMNNPDPKNVHNIFDAVSDISWTYQLSREKKAATDSDGRDFLGKVVDKNRPYVEFENSVESHKPNPGQDNKKGTIYYLRFKNAGTPEETRINMLNPVLSQYDLAIRGAKHVAVKPDSDGRLTLLYIVAEDGAEYVEGFYRYCNGKNFQLVPYKNPVNGGGDGGSGGGGGGGSGGGVGGGIGYFDTLNNFGTFMSITVKDRNNTMEILLKNIVNDRMARVANPEAYYAFANDRLPGKDYARSFAVR